MNVHKKIVVDEQGTPQAVLIPWNEFQEMAEMLGLDLDSEAMKDLREAYEDRKSGKKGRYLSM